MYDLKFVVQNISRYRCQVILRLFEDGRIIKSVYKRCSKTDDLDLIKLSLIDRLKCKTNVLNKSSEDILFDLEYRRCKWCANLFKKTHEKMKFCDKYCRDDFFKNELYKTRLERKRLNQTIIRETITNKGYLPEEFNQIDELDNLGNSNLREQAIRNNTGEIDYNKELEALRKEKKRLGL